MKKINITESDGSLVGWLIHSSYVPPFGYTCRPAGALGYLFIRVL